MGDTIYAARLLRRNPMFTLTAVLSLAVGIAGNTAIFSMADALLLRPKAGIADPARLVGVGRTQRGAGFDSLSYLDYIDLRKRNTVFEGLVGYRTGDPFGVGAEGDAISVSAGQVSGNYFSTLGVSMALGRGILPTEERVNDPSAVAVLGHGLWTRHFAADPSVVGRTIRVNGRPVSIVGVAAAGFAGVSLIAEELWVPVTTYPEDGDARLTERSGRWLQSVGRLRPGVSPDQARAEIQRIGQDLAREYPASNREVGATVAGTGLLPPDIQALATGFVGVLFALVGLILLVACANVAGMQVARGTERARELAVRVALGAGRRRILRLLVMESLLLAAGGCATGLALAYAAINLLRTLLPVLPVAVAFDFRLDWRVVAFSVAVSGLATAVMGLAPALQAARASVVTAMKPDLGGRGRVFGLRQGFVLTQVALSVLVVVCAVMLGRSLRSAASIDPGFEASGVDLIGLELNLGGYTLATGPAFADRLLARAAQLPGVRAVGSARVPPLMMQGFSKSALWPSDSPGDERTMLGADWNLVTPGYFAALQVPILRGRSLTDADRRGAADVAVVNETLARRVWPDDDPVGQTLAYSPRRGEYARIQVVGVARDAKYRSLGETPRPHLYVPLAQHYHPEMYLMVRREGRTAIPAMRALLRELDPALPITMASTLSDATAVGLVPTTLAAWVSGAAGAIGVLLAALGIYGLTAYTVSRRTREIGVRVALGAQRAQVLRLVLGQSAVLAVGGATIGLALAAAATRLLATLLFGVTPLDPLSFAGGAAVFALLALVASVVPSRHALAINPVDALRAE